jgi:hypothetical protein
LSPAPSTSTSTSPKAAPSCRNPALRSCPRRHGQRLELPSRARLDVDDGHPTGGGNRAAVHLGVADLQVDEEAEGTQEARLVAERCERPVKVDCGRGHHLREELRELDRLEPAAEVDLVGRVPRPHELLELPEVQLRVRLRRRRDGVVLGQRLGETAVDGRVATPRPGSHPLPAERERPQRVVAGQLLDCGKLRRGGRNGSKLLVLARDEREDIEGGKREHVDAGVAVERAPLDSHLRAEEGRPERQLLGARGRSDDRCGRTGAGRLGLEPEAKRQSLLTPVQEVLELLQRRIGGRLGARRGEDRKPSLACGHPVRERGPDDPLRRHPVRPPPRRRPSIRPTPPR